MAPHNQTAYSDTDWQYYLKVRPEYPQSLIDIIIDYHKSHANAEWNRVADIGCGIGVALASFVPYFKVLHASDPSSSNLDNARKYLAGQVSKHNVEASLEFSQSLGENAYKEVGEASCDLVICATTAHFMDPDALVASAARMLRPGGTLAIYSYWIPLFPDQTEEFEDTFIKLFMSSLLTLEKIGDQGSRRIISRVLSNSTAGSGGLDFLPIPPEYFAEGQRVRFNSGNNELLYRNKVLEYSHFTDKPAESRVAPTDKILDYSTGKDPQAEGWTMTVGKQWLYDLIGTVANPEAKDVNEEVQKDYADFGRIFDTECPSGTVRVVYPSQLVLGTRK